METLLSLINNANSPKKQYGNSSMSHPNLFLKAGNKLKRLFKNSFILSFLQLPHLNLLSEI